MLTAKTAQLNNYWQISWVITNDRFHFKTHTNGTNKICSLAPLCHFNISLEWIISTHQNWFNSWKDAKQFACYWKGQNCIKVFLWLQVILLQKKRSASGITERNATVLCNKETQGHTVIVFTSDKQHRVISLQISAPGLLPSKCLMLTFFPSPYMRGNFRSSSSMVL